MSNAETLQAIKSKSWDKAAVSFWIVKRRLINRQARYEVQSVNVDKKLRRKLRDIVCKRIEAASGVRDYDYTTGDLDDDLLCIETSATDFQQVIDIVTAEETPPRADSLEALVGTWMYVARLDLSDTPTLYAVRHVSRSWTAKKVIQFANVIFRDNILVDLDQKEVFRIDDRIDFMSYDGTLFIADKSRFESAMNFREGMRSQRDDLLEELVSLSIIEDASIVGDLVGDNMRRLRRLSKVKNAGYYKNGAYLDQLKKVSNEQGWGLEYTGNGTLVISEENIDDVLILLNNDRLTSLIDQTTFDVDAKHGYGD